jgi:hypothetical protein
MTEAEREILISKIKEYFESPKGQIHKEKISNLIKQMREQKGI